MKILKAIIPILLSLVIILNLTSCFLVVRQDNGKHKGWYKNPHNPHNPSKVTIIKPGNGHGKHHK